MADVVRMLFWANWRGALTWFEDPRHTDHFSSGSPMTTMSGTILRTVARAQNDLAVGRPDTAWGRLAWAAGQSGLPTEHGPFPGVTALKRPGIVTGRPAEARLLRYAGELVWREQQQILLVQQLLVDEGQNPRRAATLAMVEYLSRVEFDPWAWQPGELPAGAVRPPEARRFVLSYATGLRQSVDQSRGPIGRSVWDDARYYEGLRLLALREVCGRAEPAWLLTRNSDRQHRPVEAPVGVNECWLHARRCATLGAWSA